VSVIYGKTSEWDSAENDWETALERAGGNEMKALGLLVAGAVDDLEDLKSGVTALSDKFDARM
jgi:hypothetical protein